MVAKSEIIDELGQSDLLLPERIAASLTANDRAKYYFALIQMARENAERPIVPAPDLKMKQVSMAPGPVHSASFPVPNLELPVNSHRP